MNRLRSLCFEMISVAKQIRDHGFKDKSLSRQMQNTDWQFHNLILGAAENPTLHKIVEDHHLLLRKVRYPSLPTIRHLRLTVFEHWRIYRAMARNNPGEAGEWMLRHSRRGGEAMLQSWREIHKTNK